MKIKSFNKQPKVKQGHKLVWLTLLLILIPCAIVGYVLLTSMEEQDNPVTGSRFSDKDLSPKITETAMTSIKENLSTIPGVEEVTVNLKSATLRIHMNMADDENTEQLEDALNQAYDKVNEILPIETYFTNNEDGKMYDLEIDAYNYIVDDSHPQDGWIFLQLTKTGAGQKVTDNLTKAKDPELSENLKNPQSKAAEENNEEGQEAEQPTEDEYYEGY